MYVGDSKVAVIAPRDELGACDCQWVFETL